jgi:hypothetical protein
MNPYKIASNIRKNHIDLCTFGYRVFESLSPEMRIKINAITNSLSELANEIEYQSDKEFFGGNMSSRKNDMGDDALDYLDDDEPMMTEEEYDEYIYKEPKHGGPSIADELLSNEFAK